MIVQTIALAGWRCFLDEVTVGPFSERLNVISGPNGIGKSTLFEALRRALMDSFAVSGQDVNDLRPWGRLLSPKVTIRFVHGGVSYRMAKQFLEGCFSRLERMENGTYRPLAEGRQADEQVRELLSRKPPGRGLSQSRNWGLAQVLWAPQGELQLRDLSGDLVADIRAVLGAQLCDRISGPIEQKIVEVYDRYFTPQGKVKSGKAAPPIIDVRERLQQAQHRYREALSLHQRCEETSRQVEELGARHRQLALEATELTQAVEGVRRRAEQYRSLSIELRSRRSELEKAEAQYLQLQQHNEMIRSTAKELEGKRDELNRLESEQPLRRQEVENREQHAGNAKKALDEMRRGESIVARAGLDAETARQYAAVRKRHDEFRQLIGKIEAAEQMLHERNKARAAVVAPDRRTLKMIRQAIQERDGARLLMEASMIGLEIVPETDGHLHILSGEEPGLVPLSAGTALVVHGFSEIIAELKGVARLRAAGPAGDGEMHRRSMHQKEQLITRLTRPFGTADLSHLEELTDAADRLEHQVSEARQALAALLGDYDLDSLKNDLARLDAERTGIEQEHPDWKDSAPDNEELRHIAADLIQSHSRRVSDAESVWERSHRALSAAREQEQILLGRLNDARAGVRRLESRYAALVDDGKTVSEREAELKRILLDWDSGKAAFQKLEEKYTQFEDDPEAVLEKLEKGLAALQQSAQAIRDRERTAVGILETLTAQGPYSVLAEAEEEVARLQEADERESLRMNAVRLLYETIAQCRAEAVAAVARPVEASATRLLHRIAGRQVGWIEFGETFEPSGVSPELADSPVDLHNLSGGELEQLYLATRLALAEALARDERHMVVLDDVLTATDAGRLARIMTLLEESAERLQILLLTCHPERYRALSGAEFFDLESLRYGRA